MMHTQGSSVPLPHASHAGFLTSAEEEAHTRGARWECPTVGSQDICHGKGEGWQHPQPTCVGLETGYEAIHCIQTEGELKIQPLILHTNCIGLEKSVVCCLCRFIRRTCSKILSMWPALSEWPISSSYLVQRSSSTLGSVDSPEAPPSPSTSRL